ncbi:hypothetical protein MIND_00709800 [Mycena indigotica]|uniref:Uncharacterized protein n=1 Tax=Mycena indigotica TaxID=2126181 RepID=A0A8H6SKK6_9AGAR|nr:uncharacterized protein MIND_00709800 [Mycena indigotica]KAF7301445.1 hypothetical protein MIND_00709800 [Mycena indigotica]
MSNPAANPRASLLSGLRTGGVRSAAVPQTAAPGGSFNIPRISSGLHSSIFPEEDEEESVFATHSAPRMPMTAAVDGPGFMHQQQQQQQRRGMNPNSAPFTPFMAQQPAQASQAFQMQMMQLELLKMQAQQQYQAQMIAQAQIQQQQQQMQTPRRASYNPPATAGPLNTSFDLRSATMSAQMRHSVPLQDEQVVPMTASLDGKFGSRISFNDSPNSTTVISGGTSLGSPALVNNTTPSKSDSSNWRRGGNNNSVLSGNNRSPSVKVTPPPGESPVALSKSRPQPLSFNIAAPATVLPAVAITEGENEDDDHETSSSEKSGSNSDPTTPSTNGVPLSPREEASKKLYEGLGIGRPVVAEPPVVPARAASQPVRQPRGPPSGADELGPKNFATRIRRKAIGGLGMLMNSRERREVELVEAY